MERCKMGLFGNKSERDVKAITPQLNDVLEAYKKIVLLSNDELRAKTQELKDKISSYIA